MPKEIRKFDTPYDPKNFDPDNLYSTPNDLLPRIVKRYEGKSVKELAKHHTHEFWNFEGEFLGTIHTTKDEKMVEKVRELQRETWKPVAVLTMEATVTKDGVVSKPREEDWLKHLEELEEGTDE